MNISPTMLIIAAAKLRADEEKKKQDAKPGEGAPTLPDLGGPPMPILPKTAFQVGTAVRDIFSGWTGVVVEGPQGEFGELVFIKSDEDQQTYPVRSDQIETIVTPVPPITEMPATLPPVAAEGEAAGAPAGAPEKKEATPENKPKVGASFIVTDIGDKRKTTYASLLAKAKPTISASKLIMEFGYVPVLWDKIVAALTSDGVTVLRTNVKVDVRKLVASGHNMREILAEACKAAGPVYGETIRRINAVKGGLAVANRIKAARAENKSKLKAGKPTLPMPVGDPGQGMIYAWNDMTKEWYVTSVTAGKRVGVTASEAYSDKRNEERTRGLLFQKWNELAEGVKIKNNDVNKIMDEAFALVKSGKEIKEAITEMVSKYSVTASSVKAATRKAKPGKFKMDAIEGKTFSGYYIPTEDWNGFACPYFDAPTAKRIIREVSKVDKQTSGAIEGDKVVFYKKGDKNPDDEFALTEVDTPEGKKQLYDFGGSWTWNRAWNEYED